MSDTEPARRFACPDWWEKIQAGETPMADVALNAEKAARVTAFFNRLRLPDVSGNPPLSEACGEWFRDILCAFMAGEDPETGSKVVWELLCMVPKKSSKTTYVAALALTALYMEEAPNRQMLLVGPSQNISERCFEQAQGMIRLDEKLRAIFKVQDHLKTITRQKTGTKLDVKTFDTSIVTGEIPVLTIIDELHELGKKSKAAAVMQQIRGGGITKQRGQVLFITTQSDEEPAGIWKQELEKARAIRDGRGGKSPIMLPVLYEFPEKLQHDETFWRDRRNWSLILPNLGLSIDQQALEDDYDNNGSVSKEAEQIWASQHLNIEIGLGLHANRWVGADYWEQNAVPDLTYERMIEECEVIVFGGDAGGADDLFGLAAIGRHKVTKNWMVFCWAWCLNVVLERRPKIAPKLLDLREDGQLKITETAQEHVDEAAQIIVRARSAGLLPKENGIGLDPYGVAALIDALEAAGFDTTTDIVPVRQGFALNGAVKGLERRLLDGKLQHGGQSLMTWCVGNAKAEHRGNNVYITKETAGVAKIDPLIAMITGAVLMDMNPQAHGANMDSYFAALEASV